MDAQTFINECSTHENVIKFPSEIQLDRPVYQEVAKILGGFNGKWNRREKGFVYPFDPEPFLKLIQGGHRPNFKKDLNFFPTPVRQARQMIEFIPWHLYGDDVSILEPSAGTGRLVQEIPDCFRENTVAMDIESTFCNVLRDRFPNLKQVVEGDFLDVNDPLGHIHLSPFDVIVANPPFKNDHDIRHVRKMYELLNPGGTLVTLMGTAWMGEDHTRSIRTEFFEWFNSQNGFKKEALLMLPDKSFKESGTMVQVCMVVLRKDD